MTQPVNVLQAAEFVIPDEAELLWRQIPLAFIHNGQVGSDAFRPTPKDDGKLSTRRASKISAEDAYWDHVGRLGLQSEGTMPLSVGDLKELGIRAIDDSALPGSPAAHAYGDFRNLSKNRAKDVARRLKPMALRRGFAFRRT